MRGGGILHRLRLNSSASSNYTWCRPHTFSHPAPRPQPYTGASTLEGHRSIEGVGGSGRCACVDVRGGRNSVSHTAAPPPPLVEFLVVDLV